MVELTVKIILEASNEVPFPDGLKLNYHSHDWYDMLFYNITSTLYPLGDIDEAYNPDPYTLLLTKGGNGLYRIHFDLDYSAVEGNPKSFEIKQYTLDGKYFRNNFQLQSYIRNTYPPT